MQELIDLIIYMGRDEKNQEFAIRWDGDEWCVDFVNPCANVGLGEVSGDYQTYSKSLIEALENMVKLLDRR